MRMGQGIPAEQHSESDNDLRIEFEDPASSAITNARKRADDDLPRRRETSMRDLVRQRRGCRAASVQLMNRSPHASNSTDQPHGSKLSGETLRLFGDAIEHLGGDSEYIVRALTEMLTAIKPVAPSELTKHHVRFLIESGEFTAETLAETQRRIQRGSLQLGAAEAWLSQIQATMSLDDTVGYLGWDELEVRDAVRDRRLFAIEVSERLRFPSWQFNVGSPEKLIPGLSEVIEVVSPRWSWQSVSGFMSTPQSSLIANGRKTPVAWLRDGGDIDAVRQIVESDDWW